MCTNPITFGFAFCFLTGIIGNGLKMYEGMEDYQEQMDEIVDQEFEVAFFLLIALIPCLLITLLIKMRTQISSPPITLIKVSCIFSFVMCIAWVKFIAGCAIDILTVISFMTRLPKSLLNLTILAWANCLGDLFALKAMTQNGFGEMALTSVFAGPIFDMLIGLGLSSLSTLQSYDPMNNYIKMSIWKQDEVSGEEVFDESSIIPLTLILSCLTVISLLAFNTILNQFQVKI
mmetsp:Transcript_5119/g.8710  ORF Transcript_5119/g.8710 Transcript_5119/m.8710 type:complete len:232 (+) Transcript_5119:938-1633(+)